MIRAAAFTLLAAFAGSTQALQEGDDRGVTVSLERPPEGVATLAPHLGEVVFAAGAGAKRVGVSTFSRHPGEAERLPVVAELRPGGRRAVDSLRPQADRLEPVRR